MSTQQPDQPPEGRPRAFTGTTIIRRPGQPKPGAAHSNQPLTPDEAGEAPPPAPPNASRRMTVPRPAAAPSLAARPGVRRGAPADRWRRLGRRLRLVLLVALILAIALVGVSYWQVRGLEQAVLVRDVRPGVPLASSLVGGFNVLLVGVDERPGFPQEGVRSDTLIVVHVNTAGSWANMLSIPRDSVASIPGLGERKINTAYGYGYGAATEIFGAGTAPREGGMALAAQTVEEFLGMPARGERIHFVAQVNFDGFANLIDALGGITIDVPRAIVDESYPTPDFGSMRVEFAPGVQRMDGQRALIYARTRHSDSDFGRAQRQQQVIRAVADDLKARGPLGAALLLPELRRSVEGTISTTLPFARPDMLAGLLLLGSGLNPDEIGQLRITPEEVAVTEIGSDLYWDPSGLRALATRLYEPPGEQREAARVQVLNGTDTAGLAGRTTTELAQAGFGLLPAGDAPPGDYPRTVVYDAGGKPRTAERLARTLNAELRRGPPPAGVVSEADLVVILGRDRTP